MPVEFWNQVQTALAAPSPAPDNYIAIPAIPSSTATGLPAFASLDAKEYQTIDEMTDDGFATSSQEVLAATEIIGQDTPTPVTRWVVVALAAFVAQVEEFEVAASADGTYELFIADGIGTAAVLAATFAASGNTVTDIKDGLLVAFAIGAFAATYTGASVDADSGSVTVNTAGNAFVLTGEGPGGVGDITIANTTPNTGPAGSLDLGFAAATFWDVLIPPGTGDGLVLEYSRWAEDSKVLNSTRRNICHVQDNDAGIPDVGNTDNLALTLQVLERTRTFGIYFPSNSDEMNAATFGLYGGQQPGSRAWHMRPIAGTAETNTIRYSNAVNQLLVDRNFSWVERDGPGTNDTVRHVWGQGSGGFFVEQKQAEDFWWLSTKAAVMAVQESVEGWTLDEPGIAKMVDAVNQVNILLASFTPPVLDLAQTTVVATPLEDIPLAEQAVGDYKTSGGIFVATRLIPRGRSIAVAATFATA